MDNKTKILIIFPPVLAIILIFVATSITFKDELSEAERQTLVFTPPDFKIKRRQIIHVEKELKSPIVPGVSTAKGLPPSKTEVDLASQILTSQIEYNNNALSLIVISGKRKMAIIKGVIVKEGDSIEGMKVVKIEPQRVLLSNKTTQWIYIEKQ